MARPLGKLLGFCRPMDARSDGAADSTAPPSTLAGWTSVHPDRGVVDAWRGEQGFDRRDYIATLAQVHLAESKLAATREAERYLRTEADRLATTRAELEEIAAAARTAHRLAFHGYERGVADVLRSTQTNIARFSSDLALVLQAVHARGPDNGLLEAAHRLGRLTQLLVDIDRQHHPTAAERSAVSPVGDDPYLSTVVRSFEQHLTGAPWPVVFAPEDSR
ncbi:MAG: hypothetical protein GY772_31935 [bacterium]|nr:hypothetical protein [bacterium]